jgi:hypothetical protein
MEHEDQLRHVATSQEFLHSAQNVGVNVRRRDSSYSTDQF